MKSLGSLMRMPALEYAELLYAGQLKPVYQQFARNVARRIRVGQNTTGIYADAMAVVMSAADEELIRGPHWIASLMWHTAESSEYKKPTSKQWRPGSRRFR